MIKLKKVVFIRHGQSHYNLENRFTGWEDVDLTDEGYQSARRAGAILKQKQFTFDVAHTSVLTRAIRSLWIMLHEMDLVWIPVTKTWRLNERHYGDLQGKNKDEVMAEFGEEKVYQWRRSASIRPPALTESQFQALLADKRYAHIEKEHLPYTESLLDTEKRAVQYWQEYIVPDLQNNKHVLISAHGNTIRALMKYLDHISDEEVTSLNVPNSVPLVYEFDNDLTPINHYYVHDDEKTDKIAHRLDLNDPNNHDWIG